MERKIGEIFEIDGEWYQCLEEKYCNGCVFRDAKCDDVRKILGHCSVRNRSDKKSVIFKKLEKVGETFTIVGKLHQHYKVFDIDNVYGDVFWCVHNYKAKILTIEIKQNKEDMEEKYSELTDIVHEYMDKDMTYKDFKEAINDWVDDYVANKESDKPTLKPFDLEAAKAGKLVCTRDGRNARIICFDRRLFYKNVSYPILALVECSDGEDDVCGYNEKGKVLIEDGAEYKDDLMMLPEKKEGWVNVYKERIYSTKEEAIEATYDGVTYVDTIKISWEE